MDFIRSLYIFVIIYNRINHDDMHSHLKAYCDSKGDNEQQIPRPKIFQSTLPYAFTNTFEPNKVR